MSAIKLNEFCFAWYPKKIEDSNELGLYYCLPVSIEEEYSTCILYYGDSPDRLKLRARYNDVRTSDLVGIDEHKEKVGSALSVLEDRPDLRISTEVVPAFEDGHYQVRFTIGNQCFSLHPCEKLSENDNPKEEAEVFKINLEYALNRLKKFKG